MSKRHGDAHPKFLLFFLAERSLAMRLEVPDIEIPERMRDLLLTPALDMRPDSEQEADPRVGPTNS